jgi:hypothetical protein
MDGGKFQYRSELLRSASFFLPFFLPAADPDWSLTPLRDSQLPDRHWCWASRVPLVWMLFSIEFSFLFF